MDIISILQIKIFTPFNFSSLLGICRFKSVCKSWRALIQTSYFMDLHANYSSSSSNFGSFILRTDYLTSEEVILMLSEYEGSEYGGSEHGDWYRCTDGSWHKFTGGGGGGDDQLLLKVDNLELRSCYKKSTRGKVAGSCNGLICLHYQKLRDVSLWNPATRQFRTLPKSITIEIDDDDFVAFGFDVKTKDYKVLLISNFSSNRRTQWPPKFFSRSQVYSLSTDSWRLLEGVNSSLVLLGEHHGLYLNGSCFIIANVYQCLERYTANNMFIIYSFDFTKEIFTTMQLPDHDDRHHLFLRCFGGGEKMALFTTLRKTSTGEYDYHNYEHNGYEDCDIWVLNEHASCCDGGVNKESWTKLHSFQIRNCRRGQPIGISNNGKFAFLETTELAYSRSIQLYNLVTKEVIT